MPTCHPVIITAHYLGNQTFAICCVQFPGDMPDELSVSINIPQKLTERVHGQQELGQHVGVLVCL